MRTIILVMLITVPAFAQDQSQVVAAARGPKTVAFTVKQDEAQHSPMRPEPGKALIYFVQETGAGNCLGPCVTRIGLDRAWVGAFKHNSYFAVSVDPGEQSCVY